MSTETSTADQANDLELPHDSSDDEEVPEPPYLKTGKFGLLGDVFRNYRYRSKLRRYAGKGYVLWEIVDDARTGPKFVKPNYEGNGIPEIKHDGDRYLFPRSARVPDKRTGMWFYRHKKGDAVPINLQNPDEQALDPGVLQRYRDMAPETESPGFFDNLDLDPQKLFMYLIIGIAGFAVLGQVTGLV